MMETTNSIYMPESTTSQLLVYDPGKAFFTINHINSVFSINIPKIYLGNNILLGEIRHGNYVFNFNTTFEYLVIEENGFIFIRNPRLNIDYIVEDFLEIVPSLLDELIYLWNTYALVDDNQITSDAIEFKQAILDLYRVSKVNLV